MRIGVNAGMFKNEHKTGIPIAVENVLKSWSENHPENEYFLFSRKKHNARIYQQCGKTVLLQYTLVFAYPSLYEGFGLPIPETFDSHLPVITSRFSSMPEVSGDAVFYIDEPYDTDALVQQLRTVLTLSAS